MPKAAKVDAKSRSLAAMVDELYEMQQGRYALQNKAKKIKADEDKIEEAIIKALKDSKSTTGIAGKVATAKLVDKEKLIVEDWDRLYKYILKEKCPEMLQRRLSEEAVKERLNEGVTVPGVNKMRIKDLSLGKV